MSTAKDSAATYSIVSGFFIQDDLSSTCAEALPARFGLIDSSERRWAAFLDAIRKMNAVAQAGVSVKVIFAGRHGEGWHNVAEQKYRGDAWHNHWAALNGDGDIIWGPDPLLTPLGTSQAQSAHALWEQERAAPFNIPLPSRFYCSPLTRALQTFKITFDGIADELEGRRDRPFVMENIREQYGIHTCDKRRSKSSVVADFPEILFEDGFSEEDVLYSQEEREPRDHVPVRSGKVLDWIWAHEEGDVISITSHNEFINGLIALTGHRPYSLPTGGVLPMVIRRSPHKTDSEGGTMKAGEAE